MKWLAILIIIIALVSCSEDPTGPSIYRYDISVTPGEWKQDSLGFYAVKPHGLSQNVIANGGWIIQQSTKEGFQNWDRTISSFKGNYSYRFSSLISDSLTLRVDLDGTTAAPEDIKNILNIRILIIDAKIDL